jgi:hypothetical protein
MSQAIAIAIATTCARVGGDRGHQRLVREALVEIDHDREALGQPVPVDLEHRHQALRIERAIVVGLLLAVAQVDRAAFVIDALEVERDAHAVGGGRAEIIVEDLPSGVPFGIDHLHVLTHLVQSAHVRLLLSMRKAPRHRRVHHSWSCVTGRSPRQCR